MAPVIVTPDQMLERGLSLVNYALNRQRVSRKTLLRRFRGHYGSNPVVYAEMFIVIGIAFVCFHTPMHVFSYSDVH
jgi:hypothetical protein